jgi:DNA-binding NtrC family response regulator
VIAADSGTQAIEICSTFEGVIDLLLTDDAMSEMSGAQISALVHPMRPKMKVLFMSGYIDDQGAGHEALAPNEFLLEKPFNSQQLLTRVRESLSSGEKTSLCS